jgi:hypothetical protein
MLEVVDEYRRGYILTLWKLFQLIGLLGLKSNSTVS